MAYVQVATFITPTDEDTLSDEFREVLGKHHYFLFDVSSYNIGEKFFCESCGCELCASEIAENMKLSDSDSTIIKFLCSECQEEQ